LIVDLNADVGEMEGEEPLYALVTSVNVACGGHAGDVASMALALRRAAAHDVGVGAHPSYPDREHFGRRTVEIPTGELMRSLTLQVRALSSLCREAGVPLLHVKPHGALYHDASAVEGVSHAIADAVAEVDPDLVLVGLAGSPALGVWRARGHHVRAEGFLDRTYEADGSLRSRRHADALIVDPARAAEQALRLVRGGGIDTLCVHGDTPGAAELVRGVRRALTEAGIAVGARGHTNG
jgi:UPF0271 protein